MAGSGHRKNPFRATAAPGFKAFRCPALPSPARKLKDGTAEEGLLAQDLLREMHLLREGIRVLRSKVRNQAPGTFALPVSRVRRQRRR